MVERQDIMDSLVNSLVVEKSSTRMGNCNFCTRGEDIVNPIYEIKSSNENRHMVVVMCSKCLEELKGART